MSAALDKLTAGVIVVNAVAFAVGCASAEAAEFTEIIEHAALVYMILELGFKLRETGWQLGRFARDPWNGFDAVLIALSLLATVPAAGALRIARAARLLKIAHFGRHAVVLRGVTLAMRRTA